MGEPAFLSEEFSNNLDPDVEIVTTSGYGKNGALCILQRSIRPQVKNEKITFIRLLPVLIAGDMCRSSLRSNFPDTSICGP